MTALRRQSLNMVLLHRSMRLLRTGKRPHSHVCDSGGGGDSAVDVGPYT